MGLETAFEVGRLYGPIKSIADVLTASQKDVFVRLPGLVAYWPMGIRTLGDVVEHGGSGIILNETGVCPTGYDGVSPYAHLGNGTNYVHSANAILGVTGTETFIETTLRGLTIGCWLQVDALPAVAGGILGKFGILTNYGYALIVEGGGEITNYISANGSALTYAQSAPVSVGEWIFVTGRFDPSTEVSVFVNGVKTVNTTAIPSSCNVSTQNFEMGRSGNSASRLLHSRTRDAFVCAAALSEDADDVIDFATREGLTAHARAIEIRREED